MIEKILRKIQNLFKEQEPPQADFKSIEEINKNHNVKSKIMEFIENQDFLFEKTPELLKDIAISKTLEAFEKLQDNIKDVYGIKKGATLTYFSLDTQLFPKLFTQQPILISFSNYIEGNDQTKYITGKNIKKIYSEEMEDLIEKIETNLHLLPPTTLKYISSAKSSKPVKPFKKISDEFEYNVFLQITNKNISVIELGKYFECFKKIKELEYKFVSLYFFSKSLKETSNSNKGQESYEALNSRVMSSINSTMENIHKQAIEDEKYNGFGQIYQIMKSDREFSNEIISFFLEKEKPWRLFYFFFHLTKHKPFVEEMDRHILASLNKACKLSGVNLLISTEEFKKTYLKEHKRQFYINHPNYAMQHSL